MVTAGVVPKQYEAHHGVTASGHRNRALLSVAWHRFDRLATDGSPRRWSPLRPFLIGWRQRNSPEFRPKPNSGEFGYPFRPFGDGRFAAAVAAVNAVYQRTDRHLISHQNNLATRTVSADPPRTIMPRRDEKCEVGCGFSAGARRSMRDAQSQP